MPYSTSQTSDDVELEEFCWMQLAIAPHCCVATVTLYAHLPTIYLTEDEVSNGAVVSVRIAVDNTDGELVETSRRHQLIACTIQLWPYEGCDVDGIEWLPVEHSLENYARVIRWVVLVDYAVYPRQD